MDLTDITLELAQQQLIATNELTSKYDEVSKKRNKDHKESMEKESIEADERSLNFQEIVDQGVEKKRTAIVKQKADSRIEKAINEQINKKTFTDYVDDFKDGLQKFYDGQKTGAQLLSNVGDAFKQDLGLVTMALGPLMSLPGVNTAITILKSGALFLLKNISKLLTAQGRADAKAFLLQKKKWAYEKYQNTRERIRKRMEKNKKPPEQMEMEFPDQKKESSLIMQLLRFFFRVLLLKAITGFFKTVFTSIFSFLTGTKLTGFIVRNTIKLGGLISGLFNGIASIFTSIGNKIRGSAVLGKLKPLLKILMGALKQFLKFVAWPLSLVIAAGLLINETLNSFMNTQGNFMQKLIVGLKNGIGVIINFFVGSLLDFVKDTLAWVIGFFSTDLKKKLNDFSFTVLISDMFASFDDSMLSLGGMMQAVGAGFKGAIKAGMPGGQTPTEGFNQAYNASMAGSADATAAASYFYTPESGEKEIDLFTPKSGEKVMTASTDAKESSKSSTVMNGGNSSVVNAPVINNNIIPSPIVNTNPLNLAGAYSSVPLNY